MKHSLLILISGLIVVFALGIIPATAFVSMDDYGDAPDTYSTLWVSNGAFHWISDLYLGAGVNNEIDGQPSAFANIDFFDDGVEFVGALVPGNFSSINVTSSLDGILNAWIDFNGDGNWTGADEWIFHDISLAAGINILSFDIPVSASLDFTYARFRLNSTGGLNYGGEAFDGEVEDYRVEITNPVPAPAAIILFGIGLLGLAGAGRKKITR